LNFIKTFHLLVQSHAIYDNWILILSHHDLFNNNISLNHAYFIIGSNIPVKLILNTDREGQTDFLTKIYFSHAEDYSKI